MTALRVSSLAGGTTKQLSASDFTGCNLMNIKKLFHYVKNTG